jgi:hypothetical protein
MDIVSCGNAGFDSGSDIVAGFTGEVAGVSSKGVRVGVLAIISKLDWLDAGLVINGEAATLIGDCVNFVMKPGIGCTVVWLSVKRPRLSLLCLISFAYASVVVSTVDCSSWLMSVVYLGCCSLCCIVLIP